MHDTIWPFRVLIYLNPFYWGVPSFNREQVLGSDYFTGTKDCNLTDPSCPRGFTCPGSPAALCYGRNGEEVLLGLHTQYPLFSVDDEFAQNFAVILVYAILVKMIHLLVIYLGSRGRVDLLSPTRAALPRKVEGVLAGSDSDAAEEETALKLMYGQGEEAKAMALVISDVSVELPAEEVSRVANIC